MSQSLSFSSQQEALNAISHDLALATTDNFFHALTRSLAHIIGVDYAMIGSYDDNLNRIQVLSYWHCDHWEEKHFVYELAETPCDRVIDEQKLLCITEHAQKLYPQDVFLQDIGAVSYMGLPLVSSTKEPLGLIILLHRDIFPDPEVSEKILRIYSSRVAADLERIEREKEIRATEARFNLITDNIQEVISISDHTGTVLYISSSIYKLVGTWPDEILGQNCFDNIHPDDRAWVEHHFAPLFKEVPEAETLTLQYRVKHKNGGYLWIEKSGVPIQHQNGYQLLWTARDISAQKKSQNTLELMSQQLALTPSDSFFPSLLHGLADILGVDYVFLGEYDLEHNQVSSPWMLTPQGFTSISFPIPKSPFEKIVRKKTPVFVKEAIGVSFPGLTIPDPLKPLSFYGTPLINSEENVIGVLAVFTELESTPLELIQSILRIYSTRVAAELERTHKDQVLKASEEKFRLIAQNIQDIVVMGNLGGKILYISPSISSSLGYSIEEVLGMGADKLIHRDDFREIMQNVATPNPQNYINHSISFELRARHKEGHWVWHEASTTIIQNPDDGNYLSLTVARNISNRKATLQALEESEARYRTLFEYGFDGILVYDIEENKVISVNQVFADLLETDVPTILNHSPAKFMPTTQPDGSHSISNLKEHYENLLATGRVKYEWMHLRSNGTEVLTEVTGFVLPPPNQKLAVYIFKDLTEMREAQATLEAKVRELDEKNHQLQKYIDSNLQLENFAYVASHDLKEPLRTIGKFTQLLQRRYDDLFDQSGKEFMDFIVGGVQDLNALIDDLLLYSRVDAETTELEPVYLPDLLQNVQDSLSGLIEENGAKIKIGQLPKEIKGNSTKLKQLFQNLLTNAIKFRKQSVAPRIQVSARARKGLWEFAVQDNGIGISPAYHAKIFKLFRKLHSRDEYRGTGIGLALCKKIVEQHGGSIWVNSNEGEGATFYFTLST